MPLLGYSGSHPSQTSASASLRAPQGTARNYLWWPRLDKAIEFQVKSCKEYQSVKICPTEGSSLSLDLA